LQAKNGLDNGVHFSVPGSSIGFLVGVPAECPPPAPVNANVPVVLAAKILNPTCVSPAPTQLLLGASLSPTTTILWAGSNDLLFAILFVMDPTDPSTFAYLYNYAATTMAGASKNLIVANLPDITLTPYLTSVPKFAALLNMSVKSVQSTFGLALGDMVTPYAYFFPPMPLPEYILDSSGNQVPVVIRASKVSALKDAVAAYNAVIQKAAQDNHATLVDIYSLVNDLAAKGTVVGGKKLTTDFGGGLFSLDGVHPTNVGYAILANEFIKTINRSFGSDIPPVSIAQVSKTDPLYQPAIEGKKNPDHVSATMADGLRALMAR